MRFAESDSQAQRRSVPQQLCYQDCSLPSQRVQELGRVLPHSAHQERGRAAVKYLNHQRQALFATGEDKCEDGPHLDRDLT